LVKLSILARRDGVASLAVTYGNQLSISFIRPSAISAGRDRNFVERSGDFSLLGAFFVTGADFVVLRLRLGRD